MIAIRYQDIMQEQTETIQPGSVRSRKKMNGAGYFHSSFAEPDIRKER
jgi:hypothetical protein